MRDIDIRVALRKEVIAEFSCDSLIVDEFVVPGGNARIDMAVVNGALHGFEIKSDADTLRRLKGQSEAYGLIFDHVTLVLGGRHERAIAHVPDWWGIYEVCKHDAEVQIERMRESSQNPTLDPALVLRLLWRAEVEAMLRQSGAEECLSPKLKAYEVDRLALDLVPLSDIKAYVRETLKHRPTWRLDAIRT